MEISSANISSLVNQTTSDNLSVQVLKKALDIQSQNALALIDSLPKPASPNPANNPSHLGQHIDIKA